MVFCVGRYSDLCGKYRDVYDMVFEERIYMLRKSWFFGKFIIYTCCDKVLYKELWEIEEIINFVMMVDKELLNCEFKGEWDLFRKGGKGKSKIFRRFFFLSNFCFWMWDGGVEILIYFLRE